MPEGDAVWRTARRLHTALAGSALAGADLRVPALATRDLAGRRTLEVVPRGKHLLHRLEGGLTLHSHLRMDGSWRLLTVTTGAGVTPDHPATRRHTVRAVLWTDSALAVGDSLGMLDLVRTADEARVVGHLGPDLLDLAFDRDEALSNLVRQPGRPVAEALLDQRNLAGIGTIYASEPLFEHRISPWTPVGALSRHELGSVVDTARLWMVRSCRLGPTVPMTALARGPADGWLPGHYRVFGRRGRDCPRCGATITEQPIGEAPRERVISFCPTCQPTP
ncbi:DNA-formamidopyrimidine glycosylase family protein [Ornithinimicrobium cavernae]|uniref:DNA-formamidopyrimidine glycosylase family protein n=1 Tax=Ornithinimicrobium cavernae TaxID=2666047 RepID=UPI000D694AA0|nr:DNA-formamidopyrimidine glycosylase family protein [Ornithinimicrobium cavernae]